MNEEWKDKLKQRLAGHRKTPPTGLWEGISEQMGFQTAVAPQSASYRWLRWAVAAVVLALVGLFAFYFDEPSATQPLQDRVATSCEAPAQPVPPVQSVESGQPVPPQPVPKAVKRPRPAEPACEDVDMALMAELREPEEIGEEGDTTDVSQSATSSTQPITTVSSSPPLVEVQFNDDSYQAPVRISRRWTVGLNASGGLLAEQNAEQVERVNLDPMASNSEFLSSEFVNTGIYTLTETVLEHHLPVKLGLHVSYQLSHRVALLSGLSYTYLYSRFSVPLYAKAVTDQRLHYVGVPLGVSWQLWAARRFSLYATGGVLVEKCVNDEAWQWSVTGAAGAEYEVASQLGIYMEPSLGYYFDDGTRLEHYYKKHPLAPALKLGVRLHLK